MSITSDFVLYIMAQYGRKPGNILMSETTLCLRKKRHPFYFCDIFVRFHPILLIFGRNIPPGNLKQAHVHGPHHVLFYMFVLYLVKTGDASEHTLRRRPLPIPLCH